MPYEETILIKLDKETKRRMKKANSNWSELIRKFILIELNKKGNLARAERVRARLFRDAKGPESTVLIRKMREIRYGAGSS